MAITYFIEFLQALSKAGSTLAAATAHSRGSLFSFSGAISGPKFWLNLHLKRTRRCTCGPFSNAGLGHPELCELAPLRAGHSHSCHANWMWANHTADPVYMKMHIACLCAYPMTFSF